MRYYTMLVLQEPDLVLPKVSPSEGCEGPNQVSERALDTAATSSQSSTLVTLSVNLNLAKCILYLFRFHFLSLV